MKLLKRKIQNLLITSVVSIMLGVLYSPALQADDTDIYINSTTAADEPLVMLMLDWRPNLGSTVCNSFSGGDSDATIAANCGWDVDFVSNLSAADKSDGNIQRFELLRGVLKTAMAGLDGVKIGIMMNHDNSCTPNSSGPSVTGCSNGAYILSGFKTITSSPTDANKLNLFTKLDAIPVPQSSGSASHQYQGKELYFEYFRYLTGQGIHNGHLGWDDYDLPGSYNLNEVPNPLTDPSGSPNPDRRDVAWDTTIESGTNYITPFQAGAICVRAFAINFMFGTLNQQGDSDNDIKKSISNGGMDGLLLNGGEDNQFNTVLQWMHNNDFADNSVYSNTPNIDGKQNVTSYFVVDGVDNKSNGYASAGGSSAALEWTDDPEEMLNTLNNIFSQILSVSTTFVSASVPVNVFNRAEFLDDVYMALFEAEENSKPYWIGNLKKLKLTTDSSGDLFIGDANQKPAFSADGRINFDALTFWTDPTGADVVAFDATKGEISGADGRSINRGGAGQKIPGFLNPADLSSRNIYTEPASYTNGTPSALMSLDATTTNASGLWSEMNADGVESSGSILNNTRWSSSADYASATVSEQAEALNMLKWARGIDVMDEDIDGDTTDIRPWLVADPIHSRPLTINYGATGGYTVDNPNVRIVMTGNDGFIHMFNNTTTSATESGVEAWSFIPRYGLRILNRLMRNSVGSPLHPYGVDSAPTVYAYDSNGDGNLNWSDGDKVYIYFGMRRGGRHYYAMDISNPDQPRMLWHISDSDPDFAELGLTFSKPQLIRLNYDTYTLKPALIFGGGYDTNKDTRSSTAGTDDSRGNSIFIVDAEDGSLIWKATKGVAITGSTTVFTHTDLLDSIPSDVTAIDANGDLAADRFYVGDTGGNIWRGDINTTNRSSWKLQLFAKVGRHYSNNKKDDRRFFHAIDVVQSRDQTGPFDAVIIGSGDRPNPLDRSILSTKIPENWFYMFKDRAIVSGTDFSVSPYDTRYPYTPANLADLTDNCMQEYGLGGCSGTTTAKLQDAGWMIKLEQAVGEKVLSRPITLNGIIFFTTYKPPSSSGIDACEPDEGSGLTYAVGLQDATAVLNFNLTNSVSSATGEVIELQSGDRFRDAGAGIPADVIAIRKNGDLHAITPGDNYTTNLNTNSGYKTFWYVEGE